MARVVERYEIAPKIIRFVIEDPELARLREPGQFLIIRANTDSERIPLSIAGADPERGTVDIVVQEVGRSSAEICAKQVGDEMCDVVGPLGKPTHIEKFGTVVCVGGGLGIAPLYPIARALREAGNAVISILGARTRELVIFEDKMRSISHEVIISTDDGSYGRKGVVTQPLKELLDSGRKIDFCLTVGPPIMMKFVCETTRPYNVRTWASLNTVMVDGTGMCGACRVTVGGKTRFVCVDGPEFDGHLVDFDQMMRRLNMFRDFEKRSYDEHQTAKSGDADHECKISLRK